MFGYVSFYVMVFYPLVSWLIPRFDNQEGLAMHLVLDVILLWEEEEQNLALCLPK